MLIEMSKDLVFVDERGLQWLRYKHIYEIPEEYANMILKDNGGMKYVRLQKV